jgi:hypothetical protein
MKLKPMLFVSFVASLSLACFAQDPLEPVKDTDMRGPVGTVTAGDRIDCGFDRPSSRPENAGERVAPPPSIEISGLPEGTPAPSPLHLAIKLTPNGSGVKLTTLKVLYLRDTRKDLTSLIKERMDKTELSFESDVAFPQGDHAILICVRDNNNIPAMKLVKFTVK